MGMKEWDQARRRLVKGWEQCATDRGAAAIAQVSADVINDLRVCDLVNDVLDPSTPPAMRAAALGDLLAAYGVGTIVAGPIG